MTALLEKLPLLHKIAIPAALILAVVIGIIAFASFSLANLSANAVQLVDGNAKRLELALDAESLFNSAAVSEKNVILADDEQTKRKNIETYQNVVAAVLDTLVKLAPLTVSADQKNLIDAFSSAVRARQQSSAQVFDLSLAGKTTEAFELSSTKGAQLRQDAIGAVGKLIAIDRAEMLTARDAAIAEADHTRFVLIAGSLAGLVIAFAFLAWIAVFQTSRPLAAVTAAMKRLAGNDLNTVITGIGRNDEVGAIAAAVQIFKDNMIAAASLRAEQKAEQERKEQRQKAVDSYIQDFDKSVSGSLEMVASASTELESTAKSMSATADLTQRQSTAVAAASEQASTNVQTVASAAEELSSSISEISRQVAESTRITSQAVTETEKTNVQIQGLAEAAQRIGDVVKLISDIAGQTNLLALNATIEAARAGEAGKGFAVVASEVKSLAGQTAKATEEISSKIAEMQSATSQSVQAVQGIAQTIGSINEIATTIASAVEEQGAATQEIARNVQQASAGTTEVSSNIVGVTKAANDAGEASGQVLSAAGELSKQSETLRGQVDTFLSKIRAA